MFKSLRVQNFRRLKDVTLDPLARVNFRLEPREKELRAVHLNRRTIMKAVNMNLEVL